MRYRIKRLGGRQRSHADHRDRRTARSSAPKRSAPAQGSPSRPGGLRESRRLQPDRPDLERRCWRTARAARSSHSMRSARPNRRRSMPTKSGRSGAQSRSRDRGAFACQATSGASGGGSRAVSADPAGGARRHPCRACPTGALAFGAFVAVPIGLGLLSGRRGIRRHRVIAGERRGYRRAARRRDRRARTPSAITAPDSI